MPRTETYVSQEREDVEGGGYILRERGVSYQQPYVSSEKVYNPTGQLVTERSFAPYQAGGKRDIRLIDTKNYDAASGSITGGESYEYTKTRTSRTVSNEEGTTTYNEAKVHQDRSGLPNQNVNISLGRNTIVGGKSNASILGTYESGGQLYNISREFRDGRQSFVTRNISAEQKAAAEYSGGIASLESSGQASPVLIKGLREGVDPAFVDIYFKARQREAQASISAAVQRGQLFEFSDHSLMEVPNYKAPPGVKADESFRQYLRPSSDSYTRNAEGKIVIPPLTQKVYRTTNPYNKMGTYVLPELYGQPTYKPEPGEFNVITGVDAYKSFDIAGNIGRYVQKSPVGADYFEAENRLWDAAKHDYAKVVDDARAIRDFTAPTGLKALNLARPALDAGLNVTRTAQKTGLIAPDTVLKPAFATDAERFTGFGRSLFSGAKYLAQAPIRRVALPIAIGAATSSYISPTLKAGYDAGVIGLAANSTQLVAPNVAAAGIATSIIVPTALVAYPFAKAGVEGRLGQFIVQSSPYFVGGAIGGTFKTNAQRVSYLRDLQVRAYAQGSDPKVIKLFRDLESPSNKLYGASPKTTEFDLQRLYGDRLTPQERTDLLFVIKKYNPTLKGSSSTEQYNVGGKFIDPESAKILKTGGKYSLTGEKNVPKDLDVRMWWGGDKFAEEVRVATHGKIQADVKSNFANLFNPFSSAEREIPIAGGGGTVKISSFSEELGGKLGGMLETKDTSQYYRARKDAVRLSGLLDEAGGSRSLSASQRLTARNANQELLKNLVDIPKEANQIRPGIVVPERSLYYKPSYGDTPFRIVGRTGEAGDTKLFSYGGVRKADTIFPSFEAATSPSVNIASSSSGVPAYSYFVVPKIGVKNNLSPNQYGANVIDMRTSPSSVTYDSPSVLFSPPRSAVTTRGNLHPSPAFLNSPYSYSFASRISGSSRSGSQSLSGSPSLSPYISPSPSISPYSSVSPSSVFSSGSPYSSSPYSPSFSPSPSPSSPLSPSSPFSPSPPGITLPPIPRFGLSGFGLDFGTGGKPTKRELRYSPSLFAISEGVSAKGKAPRGFGKLTGLEVRPFYV